MARTDKTLDELNEERDHVEIQISLLSDTEVPNELRLKALRNKLYGLRQRIEGHKIVWK